MAKLKPWIAALLAVGCMSWLGACGTKSSEPLVEVKIISVHRHTGGWTDPFTHAIYERLDTHERRAASSVLGEPGETFRAKWSDLTWNQ